LVEKLILFVFYAKIENNNFIIIDWSNSKNRIFIFASFLLQGISLFELKEKSIESIGQLVFSLLVYNFTWELGEVFGKENKK
jgi:hypothetical protein